MYSKTFLIGRLGQDPKLNNSGSGTILALSVATSERYKDNRNGEWKEITTWHNVQVWGKLAEAMADKLMKGDLVFVEGTYRTYKKEDKTYYNLRADSIRRLTPRPKAVEGAGDYKVGEPKASPEPADPAQPPLYDPAHPDAPGPAPDDDCPF